VLLFNLCEYLGCLKPSWAFQGISQYLNLIFNKSSFIISSMKLSIFQNILGNFERNQWNVCIFSLFQYLGCVSQSCAFQSISQCLNLIFNKSSFIISSMKLSIFQKVLGNFERNQWSIGILSLFQYLGCC
jgi:hypothetical protein